MKALKGFEKDLTCRGFQYAVGETYEHDGAVRLCGSGFHAVTLPLDVFRYYPLSKSIFHEVEVDGVVEEAGGDSKVAARKITVGASLNLAGLVKAHVDAVFDRVKKPSSKASATTGDYAHAATTGRYANAATTGYSAQIRSSVKDETAIAAVLGQGAAKGVEGSWLVLTERDVSWNILGVQAVQVDGKKVKADTFYSLLGGKVTEVV